MQKSSLATPAGVDHDFNFITSIERSVARAEQYAEALGAGSREEKIASRPQEAATRLYHRHLLDADVNVKRVPSGMVRAKENKSNLSRRYSQIRVHQSHSPPNVRVVLRTKIAKLTGVKNL